MGFWSWIGVLILAALLHDYGGKPGKIFAAALLFVMGLYLLSPLLHTIIVAVQ